MSTHEAVPKRKHHCNECGHETWHSCLWTQRLRNTEHSGTKWEVVIQKEHIVLECRGCEAVSFVILSARSDDTEDDGAPAVSERTYPPKTLREHPPWYGDLLVEYFFEKKPFLKLLSEVYVALQNGCPSLAVMGIRAILEAVMIETCGDQGTFIKNLNKFQDLGYISDVQRKAVEPVLEAGHATIHRAFEPTDQQALVSLDITENIVESIFVSREKAGSLKGAVPSRKRDA